MTTPGSPIAHNIAVVQARITAAAGRCGRDPAAITLIAVTKTHPVSHIEDAIAAGVTHLGENRVQEASAKMAALASQRTHLHWHLLGHLQRNKARLAAHLFDMVHSIDSLRLAETLNRQRQEAGMPRLPVLLQVNVSGEASKEGFHLPGGWNNAPDLPAFLADVAHILALPALQVQGLMTIAPYASDPETARPIFRCLHHLRDHLASHFPQTAWPHLSMGMTDDFEVAIEEGATLVRIGRALFGERL